MLSCQLSGYSFSINQLANQRLLLSPCNDTEHQSCHRDTQTPRSLLALCAYELTNVRRAALLIRGSNPLLRTGVIWLLGAFNRFLNQLLNWNTDKFTSIRVWLLTIYLLESEEAGDSRIPSVTEALNASVRRSFKLCVFTLHCWPEALLLFTEPCNYREKSSSDLHHGSLSSMFLYLNSLTRSHSEGHESGAQQP